MDLSDYWQENKRFVLTVASGAVVFLMGLYVVDSVYGADLNAARSAEARHKRDLRQAMYTRAAQTEAEEELAQLQAAADQLAEFVVFQPRDEFMLRSGGTSASSQFHQVVGRLRDDLLPAAARLNLRLERTLGLPKLTPTQEGSIERHLHALDVIERVARSAMEHRADRMEDLSIKLDPSLGSRAGVGRVERTKVEMTLRGGSLALTRVLADLQRGDLGTLLVDKFEIVPSRNNPDDARLDLTLVVCRMHELSAEDA